MLKNITILSVIFSLLTIGFVLPATAQVDQIKKVGERTEKFRQEIKALGVGEKVKVRIDVFDGKTYRGYIREANETNVTVVDKKGVASVIDYSQIKDVTKKAKTNAVVAGVVIGVAAGVVLGIFLTFKSLGG